MFRLFLPEGLEILCVPSREDPRDALLSRDGAPLEKLGMGARIGTSSLRRQAQLLHYRGDFRIHMLRGNLDTRLRKLHDGEYDTIIVAAAGLRRLGWSNQVTEYLSSEVSLPAIGQGALGLEGRNDDSFIKKLVGTLDHVPTRLAITAERALLARLEGGCQVPIAAHATIHENQLTLDGLIASVDGTQICPRSDSWFYRRGEKSWDKIGRSSLGSGGEANLGGDIRKRMTVDQKEAGKIFLVGAGPGDPELITLKGKNCLGQADVILFDHLANPALLKHAPSHAERIYVGRRNRGSYENQEEINRLLVTKAREGKCVVRLKGGDPFVFGRGGEEAEFMADAGLPFEIVPGVSSAVAAPAYAGIPVTHRTLASTVAFVTGHEDPDKSETALEWPRLASSDGTLVFLMGMKNLPNIVQRLLREGKDPGTPVALIRWGTYTRQRTVVGTLADIVERAQEEGIEPPTVIVIGRVVGLRAKLNWFESRPLFGMKILVTRPRDQAPGLSNLLAASGAEPVDFPTLEIVPPENWEGMDKAIGELSTYQWLVFTSANGVRYFMNRLRYHRQDVRSLAGLRVACIGPKTAEEAESHGIRADLVPSEFQAEGLVEAFRECKVAGQGVLIPRAEVARELLPEQLKEMGAKVRVVTAYRAVAPQEAFDSLKEQFRCGNIHIVTFASSSTVRNFCHLFENKEELKTLTKGVTIACIGPITAQTVQEEGLVVGFVASQNTVSALVDAIVQHV